MYNPTRWDALVTLFRITFFSLHSLPSLPSLSLSLYAGLASLKLPSCFPPTSGSDNVVPSNLNPTTAPPSLRSSPSSFMPVDAAPIIQDAVTITHATSNVDCPTCDLSPAGLGPLAQKEVPHVQHLNSTMVCGITGTVMEGENEPMVLPNGRVYSSQVGDLSVLCDWLGYCLLRTFIDIFHRRWKPWPLQILERSDARELENGSTTMRPRRFSFPDAFVLSSESHRSSSCSVTCIVKYQTLSALYF